MTTTNFEGHSFPLWIIVVAALIIVALASARSRRRSGPDQVAPVSRPTPDQVAANCQKAPDQISVVSQQAVLWQRRAVLNYNEGLVYESAQAVLEHLERGWRVWPQVSLGEVVETHGRTEADKEAYRWINSKRVDLLIVDGKGWPLAVIEYQGRGHYRSNAAERDAVKRTVLTRAGVRYIEVPAEMSKQRGQLDAHLRAELLEIATIA